MWYDIAHWLQPTVVGTLCFLGWVTIILPSISYLFTTWRRRRDKLFERFDHRTVELYFERFYPMRATCLECRPHGDAVTDFRNHFAQVYGRRHFIIPFILLAATSAVGLLATSISADAWINPNPGGAPYPAIAISAFLGAYAWGVYDQIMRFRSEDFTPNDIYLCVFRILISVPLGYSMALFLNDSVGVGAAFLLGAFPTGTLFLLARRKLGKLWGETDTEHGEVSELEQLQSVGRSNAERFHDEGITTVAELAWADPIKLTIETNREFSYVVDTISQALLWVYFEASVKELYSMSLRGAQEVCALITDLTRKNKKRRKRANETITEAARKLGMDREVFLNTLYAVREDPYSKMLYMIWH